MDEDISNERYILAVTSENEEKYIIENNTPRTDAQIINDDSLEAAEGIQINTIKDIVVHVAPEDYESFIMDLTQYYNIAHNLYQEYDDTVLDTGFTWINNGRHDARIVFDNQENNNATK